jgi:alcohol dehydrogenase class IV
MLLPVLRFNLLGNLTKFADISSALGLATEDLTDRQAAEEALDAIEELMMDLNIPLRLRDLNVPQEALPRLSEGVMKVTRLLANNPRRLTLEDAKAIYQQAW